MTIEKCVVKINSEEELRQVEDVCFEHEIGFQSRDDETRENDRFDKTLFNCVFIDDDETFYTHRISEYEGIEEDGVMYNFKPFMAKYGKKKKETKIPDCYIKTSSKKEHEMIQKICFKHGVGWAYSGKKIENYYIDKTINIRISDNVLLNDQFTFGVKLTFQQFCDKYNDSYYKSESLKYGKPTTTKKYRIKTEQEFIDEFGENWRNVVDVYFTETMDNFFGNNLTKVDVFNLKYKSLEWDGYILTKDMVKEIKDEESMFSVKMYEQYFKNSINSAFGLVGKMVFDQPKKEQFKLNDSLFSRRKLIKVNQDN